MAKTIRYGSYCIPQEQVSGSSPLDKFHLDGDARTKMGGNAVLSVTTFTGTVTNTSTTTFSQAHNFFTIKALEIEDGSLILISLDSGDTFPIRLLKGECFASKIASTARLTIAVCTATDGSGTGVGKYEAWGTDPS